MRIALVIGPSVATGMSVLLAVLYVISKQAICRKLAIVLLLIAVVMWAPVVLIGAGVIPMPPHLR